MTEPDERPDPDVLLRRLQAEEARSARARLKVFFGFAPGVGKTYSMLEGARRLAAQGVDLAVGCVETHGRVETAALLQGLEVLPRRQVVYRGRVHDELDLEGALARKPAVLLVDELAHTNIPGLRHTKRWQDVLDLLDAGIEVHTTLNVQHLESLNDVVAQITGVPVRETVPDAVLDRADEIELVDLPPEELLVRLGQGKVYIPEQARRAADHFFRRGNLLALRELALRRTAQHVDADVEEYRQEHAIATTWPAAERVMVCVGPSPTSARLVRAAGRLAAGLRAPWVAVSVESSALPYSGDDRERVESHLRLAESLGATVARVSTGRVSAGILDYARKHNVSRIVLGKPTHPRWRDRLRGSLLDEVVRGSGEIEIHAISGAAPAAAEATRTARQPAAAPPGAYAWAVLPVALATGLGLLMRDLLALPDIVMLYLLAIMLVALRFQRGPAFLAAAVSVAAYDVCFIPPFYTFAVGDLRHVLTFAMMFAVGLIISDLTVRVRRQEHAALEREERTAVLYSLSRELGRAADEGAVAEVATRQVRELLHGAAALFLGDPDGPRLVSQAGGLSLGAQEMAVVRWVLGHGRPAGTGTDTLPGAGVICFPAAVAGRVLGVLALTPELAPVVADERRELLQAFVRQVALALERARLAEEAKAAVIRAKTEEMRSSLLSAVSHDLRTPLAAITGAATALREQTDPAAAPQADLIDTICEEAERLERLVANLLDMTRLESGELVLHREWVPLEEVVGAALTRLEPLLADRPLRTDLAEDLPMVPVDPVLVEQVFLNLLENAAKYTPPGTPIEIRAHPEPGALTVEVVDFGPGLPPGHESRVFEKFYRGHASGIGGVGLGLAICQGIVQAHGGSIAAENRPGGGAVFRFTLPIVGTPPPLPVPDAEEEAAAAREAAR